jgi:hypothetical protein
MLLFLSPGTYTRWQTTDALEQEFNLCHIPGHPTLTFGLISTKNSHLTLDRRGAAQTATLLGHFARTGGLPSQEGLICQDDWVI